MRTLFATGWVVAAGQPVLAILWFYRAAFEKVENYGALGVLHLFLAIPAIAFMAWMTGIALADGFPERKARLPRADRRRLKAERARIAVDAEIARMEREAGLS